MTLAAPDVCFAAGARGGAFVAFGELSLPDSEVLRLLNGGASPHRRVVASVQQTDGLVLVSVALSDEMRALLERPSDEPWQDEVSAISIESPSLRFETEPVVFRPRQPVVFRAVPGRHPPHKVSVRVALPEEDLGLHFTWPGTQDSVGMYF
jgi:hypothetical protein